MNEATEEMRTHRQVRGRHRDPGGVSINIFKSQYKQLLICAPKPSYYSKGITENIFHSINKRLPQRAIPDTK